MRYLVTGANGFVGLPLCIKMLGQGWQVRAAVRANGQLPAGAEEGTLCQGWQAREAVRANGQLPAGAESVMIGSIDGETDWTDALRGMGVVIHLAARVHVMNDDAADPLAEFLKVNLHGTVNLAKQAAHAGVKRFVYVSSIKVNGEATHGDNRFTEADAPSPQDPYGISKWEAEQALHGVAKETGLEVVIVRPPLVYGAGVKGNFTQMLKVLAKGIPLPLASVFNMRSFIYVENLADALIICAAHPAAAGQTYLVSDGEDISTPGLLHQLSEHTERQARLFFCPAVLLKLAARLTGKTSQVERLLGSLQIDSSKIRRELAWTPPCSLQEGLRKTAEWYRSQHPC